MRAPPLRGRERLAVDALAAGDVVVRTGLATVLTAAALPWGLTPDARHERERLSFYAGFGPRFDAADVFAAPAGEVVVTRRVAGWRPPRLDDGEVTSLRFETDFATLNPAMRDAYGALVRNRYGWAQHWTHPDGPRPTIAVLHGFGASPYWLNSRFFSLPWFFHLGYDVLLYTLPLHGRRRGNWVPMNGLELFMGGFARVTEAMLHAIYELRVLVGHLLERGAPQVGATGLSLGGYTSALLAAVEPRLAFAIPNAPLASMPELIAGWPPASLLTPALSLAHGVPAELVRRALAIHSPLSYAPAIPSERLMVIGGLGDRFAPPDHAQRIAEHWGVAPHWYAGNHLVHVGRRSYLHAMRDFMAELGFAPVARAA